MSKNTAASSFARNSATDAIRASNLRTAQGMADSLGKPVESSDGQIAHPKAKPAPRKPSAVLVVPVMPDSKLANVAGRAERLTILSAINTADDLLGSSLIAALRMTATHGPTSKDEVAEGYTRCNNPDVYASTFNRGAKCAAIIGEAQTLELIAAVGDGAGAYRKAVDALGAVITQAKDAGVKTLNKSASKLAIRSAVKVATDKATAKKAAPKVARAVIRPQTQVTMAAAALACGKGHKEMAAFLKLASNAASKMPEREGREAMHREACAALATACELFHVLAK
jgi:hypothetical protein